MMRWLSKLEPFSVWIASREAKIHTQWLKVACATVKTLNFGRGMAPTHLVKKSTRTSKHRLPHWDCGKESLIGVTRADAD